VVEKNYPNPNTIYPIEGITRTVYLKNIITNPQIIVGDYTYYDDPEDVYNFEKNVLYLFDFMGDKLIIGKFCQIATGVGLYAGADCGYGPAQRLYIKRGYIPDGKGVTYNYEPTIPGNSHPLDDDLVLWFTKKLS
jgi:hypothetical protein